MGRPNKRTNERATEWADRQADREKKIHTHRKRENDREKKE